jgi:hypothetical protein
MHRVKLKNMLQCSKLIKCDFQLIKMTLKDGVFATLVVAQMVKTAC